MPSAKARSPQWMKLRIGQKVHQPLQPQEHTMLFLMMVMTCLAPEAKFTSHSLTTEWVLL